MKRLVIFLVFLLSMSLVSAISVDDFSLADLGFTGFVVEANLDTSGTAQVLYGKTGSLGSATSLSSSSSEHLLQVDGLAENTVYFYRVVGKDSSGNSYSSAISLTRTASNSGSPLNNPQVDTSELKAFPSAVGWGKEASGGRGGEIRKVTNLNNAGSGSLRAAWEKSGKATIVFEVAGTITVSSSIRATADKTVAGETAFRNGGQGITVRRNGNFGQPSISGDFDNSIIRYMRFRAGPGSAPECCGDAVTIGASRDIIFDHNTFSWATDETVNLWGDVKRVTFQNSLFDSSLHISSHTYTTDTNHPQYKSGHGKHFLSGGGNSCSDSTGQISFYNTLLAHSHDRNPTFGGECPEYELVNTVTYNLGYHGSRIGNDGSKNVNIINHLSIDGVDTRTTRYAIDASPNARIYVLGVENRKGTDWKGIGCTSCGQYMSTPAPLSWRIFTPFDYPLKDVSVLSRNQLKDLILEKAGANLERDEIDKRVITQVRNEQGGKIINHPDEVGGWPSLSPMSSTPVDVDNDGIADSWEFNVGGVVGRVDNNGDHDGDGYTNIEEYLHFLAGEGHS